MRKFIVSIDFSADAEREASEIAEQHGATEAQRYLAQLVEMTLASGNVDNVMVVGPCCECGQLHDGYEPTRCASAAPTPGCVTGSPATSSGRPTDDGPEML